MGSSSTMAFQEAFANSSSPLSPQDHPLFHVCWRRQSCSYCLAGDVACSWCAISSTCVPNAARLPILAPLGSTQLCPLAAERWEMRALPFGCHVSTLTLLSVVSAALGSGALIAAGCVIVWLAQGVRWRWKQTESERVDGQGHLPWRKRLQGWLIMPLAIGLGLAQKQRRQGANQALEDGQESETRPLLSG